VKKSPHNGLISPSPPFPLNACGMMYIQQNNDESHAPYSPWEIYQICRKRYEKRWDTGVVYVANTYRPPETPNYSERCGCKTKSNAGKYAEIWGMRNMGTETSANKKAKVLVNVKRSTACPVHPLLELWACVRSRSALLQVHAVLILFFEADAVATMMLPELWLPLPAAVGAAATGLDAWA